MTKTKKYCEINRQSITEEKDSAQIEGKTNLKKTGKLGSLKKKSAT